MRQFASIRIAAVLVVAGWSASLSAGEGRCGCHHCNAPDGCCWQEVVTHRCVIVPERKPIKKTVYECKEVPYCEHALPKFGHCDCCPSCQACPKYKKVLVKKEVVIGEICTTKCVVEEVVEMVLGPCCHCGHQDSAPQKQGETPDSAQEEPQATPPVPQEAFRPPLPVVIPVSVR